MEHEHLICDEHGKPSTARAAFWIALFAALVMIALDGLTAAVFPAEAYTLLGTVIMFSAVWAAGPRMAQYLAPQIGAGAKAIAAAAAARRGLDNRFTDDERGEVR